jgi:hypothetical protein
MTSRARIGACVVSLACLLQLPGAAGAGAVGQPPVAANTPAQAQSGQATGEVDVDVFLNQEMHLGRYVTGGQLGTGYYTISGAYDDSACTPSGGTITVSGSATFHRSDNAHLFGTFTGTEGCDTGAVGLTVNLTSGTKDFVSAQLFMTGSRTFENITPGGSIYSESLTISGSAIFTKPIGYWMVGKGGAVTGFGGLATLGSAPTTSVTHLEPTPDFKGYWIVDAAGHVYAFGDAHWLGNASPTGLVAGETVTNLSATPSGNGYWLFTSRGRALRFGDATFFGDMHLVRLKGPVIGAVATPTGLGYYMVASDGGVFAFGDARFHGSMGAAHLNRAVNGLVPTADNAGYWLVASDGGVFAFDAPFLGSMGATRLNQPVIGMARYGDGYLMVASDGGIFDFSTLMFFGSLGGTPLADPIVGVAATS